MQSCPPSKLRPIRRPYNNYLASTAQEVPDCISATSQLGVLKVDSSGERRRFLVVENDPNDAFLINRALSASPHCGSSFVCRNPSEARALLLGAGMYANRTAYPLPDVILTDMNMGAESGLELVKWIRQQSSPMKHLPIFILTGSSTLVEREVVEKAGANKVFVKPSRLEDLQALLHSIAKEFFQQNDHERPERQILTA